MQNKIIIHFEFTGKNKKEANKDFKEYVKKHFTKPVNKRFQDGINRILVKHKCKLKTEVK